MKRFSYNTFYLVQILFFSNLFSFSTILEQRSIPSNNLSYPVLINIKNRLPASGFYINNGSTIYLVTAKHVIFDSTMSLWDNSAIFSSPAKDSSETDLNTFVADLKKLQISHLIRTDSTHDAVVLKIGKILKNGNLKLDTNLKLVKKTKSGIVTVASDFLRKYSEVMIGNDVFILGYPSALGIKRLPQFDHSRPLLRKGIIAGKYKAQKTIILDCPVYQGNSGSPVIEVIKASPFKTNFRIIGLVSQFIPYNEAWANEHLRSQKTIYTNSGYSVVVPIDFVLELIEK